MKHKKYHLVFWFSLLFSILILANINAQTSYLDSLDGKYALQFQINDNFNLSEFQGATLSGKYHLGKKSAIRLGLNISFDDSEIERESIIRDTINYYESSKVNGVRFTINSQYINYLVAVNDIGFYLGAGPSIGFGHSEGESEYEITDSTVEKGSGSSNNFTIGLEVIAGVEWSFNRNMTLSAEYGMAFYYTYRKEKSEITTRKDERKMEIFGLTANSINFGLSVYF
jgi:opacity protein-like surface antigen